MMKIFKVIATPFVALWRWIKETAWVQPLLIVGCIFAVIFSIPYISQGIQNLTNSSDDSLSYYKNHLLSMNGAYKGANDNEAEKFLAKIPDLQVSWHTLSDEEATQQDKSEAQAYVDDFKNTYGEKFFFVLAKSDCEACETVSEALEYLENYQSDYNVSNFKLHTIIADEELTDDDKEYKVQSAFEMINERQIAAFETIYNSGCYGYYIENIDGSISDYMNKLDTLPGDVSSIEVPLIVMFDLTQDALEYPNSYVMSEIFFTVDGEDKIDRALQLANCWNYSGDVFGRNN